MKVTVEKDKISFVCQALNDYEWRCGKCGRGKVIAEPGCECKVCHAVVDAVSSFQDGYSYVRVRESELADLHRLIL